MFWLLYFFCKTLVNWQKLSFFFPYYIKHVRCKSSGRLRHWRKKHHSSLSYGRFWVRRWRMDPSHENWRKQGLSRAMFNTLHPNISIHILRTVLCTLSNVLTRRTCLTIKSFFCWWSFPLFSWRLLCDSVVTL